MDEYGHLCPWTPTPPKKETPPTPVPTVVSNITFRFDRPFVWEKNTTSFFSAITSESKAGFEALATQLAADPDKRVQVVGRASPEGKDEYNQQLSERRAKMVVKALTDRGIPGSQLADAPAGAAPTECVKLQTGAYACGETGADGPEDRVVEVTVF